MAQAKITLNLQNVTYNIPSPPPPVKRTTHEYVSGENIYVFETYDWGMPLTDFHRCASCGATVAKSDHQLHVEWHESILGSLMEAVVGNLLHIQGELEG